jgi:hypothetical protein
MATANIPHAHRGMYELRFRSLFDEGRAYSFPCDAMGRVDLDALSERARNNFFFVHSVIGRDFSTPEVLSSMH